MKLERTPLRTVVFCGGRGSATLVRELVRTSGVELSLIVNAYDDGLSTGALREFIPGMLGPSDFRKNLSYLVDPHDAQQYALQALLEYRFPAGFDVSIPLASFAAGGEVAGLPEPLVGLVSRLRPSTREQVRSRLAPFTGYAASKRALDYSDFAFGNLLFAGAFLQHRDFNAAVYELARFFGPQATILNVSRGECRSLVALKEDGSILYDENSIVAAQSAARIRELYFIERPISPEQRSELEALNYEGRQAWLERRELAVAVSPEAELAIERAELIVYGPGTQHSSLLPSYRIAARALAASTAAIRAFIVNLEPDHDIAGFDGAALVDRALAFMNDPENAVPSITHVLAPRPGEALSSTTAFNRSMLGTGRRYRGAAVIEEAFASPGNPRVHSGHAVGKTLLNLTQEPQPALEIYVDLYGRSPALAALLSEFSEIDWLAGLREVRLRVNAAALPLPPLPGQIYVETVNEESPFSEVDIFSAWLESSQSDYLATITGDGEYRLRDILLALRVLESGTFGAVYGSRNQSRRQFQSSLRSAYGEGRPMYALSTLGAAALTLIFGLRFSVVFSDPLTGFRVYRRSRLRAQIAAALDKKARLTAASITRLLIASGIEIAEIPVSYRTFSGFTNPRWRLARGVRNLWGVFR